MGNESSSLPATIPKDVQDVIFDELLEGRQVMGNGGSCNREKRNSKDRKLRSDLTEEKIRGIVADAMSGKKKPNKRVSREKRLARCATTDSAAVPLKKKNQALARCVTDSEVRGKSGSNNNTTTKSLQDAWSEQKKKRSAINKKECDLREELDPAMVIQLLERYSNVDDKLAKDFFESLKDHEAPRVRRSHGESSSKAETMPTAA